MQALDNLRKRIGTFLLQRDAAMRRRKRVFTPLGEAKEVAILYDSTYIDKDALIHQYVQKLRAEGKKVFMMGYVDMPNLPGNKKFSLQSDFCWREKLNFFFLPDKQKFNSFLKTEFDLLITLAENPVLPLKALSAWSHAKYRIGPKIENGLYYYDAMMDIKRSPDLATLIHEIDFYFKAITT
jgi:hypothetical protein